MLDIGKPNREGLKDREEDIINERLPYPYYAVNAEGSSFVLNCISEKTGGYETIF